MRSNEFYFSPLKRKFPKNLIDWSFGSTKIRRSFLSVTQPFIDAFLIEDLHVDFHQDRIIVNESQVHDIILRDVSRSTMAETARLVQCMSCLHWDIILSVNIYERELIVDSQSFLIGAYEESHVFWIMFTDTKSEIDRVA